MTINQLINEVAGAELQNNVRQAVTETNSVLAGCNVHYLFRGSVIDLETGRHGIRWLITRILTECGELTTREIINKVRACNGADKYPDSTIEDNLQTVMRQELTCRPVRNGQRGRPQYAWKLRLENLPPVQLR